MERCLELPMCQESMIREERELERKGGETEFNIQGIATNGEGNSVLQRKKKKRARECSECCGLRLILGLGHTCFWERSNFFKP